MATQNYREEGKQFRADRLQRGESLLECAKRIGITRSDLQTFEAGLPVSDDRLQKIRLLQSNQDKQPG